MTTDEDHTKHDHDEGEHDGQRPLPILGSTSCVGVGMISVSGGCTATV
jgi:hypothetical protein